MVTRAIATTVVLLFANVACSRGASWRDQGPFQAVLDEAAQRIVPNVEEAIGLSFKTPPDIQIRTPEQVRAYLQHRLDTDLPQARVEGVEAAYALFGLIPEDMDLRALLLPLYSEQVVGFFDPDSNALYMIEGTERIQVEAILAHELVHALQAQHTPLSEILTTDKGNDALIAGQATMEGQATLAMIPAMVPGQDASTIPGFWDMLREQFRQGQEQMPVFQSAPRIVRESLIFPYLEGAVFNDWFQRTYPDTVPFGPRLPQSTEQILHHDKYFSGDVPVRLEFDASPDLIYQDGLGEFELRIMLQELSGSIAVGTSGSLGWDGDQYGVFTEGDDKALVWWTVWDSEGLASRFEELLASEWTNRAKPGRRFTVTAGVIAGQSAVRLIDAHEGWARWSDPPTASVTENPELGQH